MNSTVDVRPDAGSTPAVPSDAVFVSYSHKDSPWVHEVLIARLKAAGIAIQSDADFKVGSLWKSGIREGLRDCPCVLVVLTPDWLKSDWCIYEGQVAEFLVSTFRGRKLLPIQLRRVEGPLPDWLRDYHFLDFSADPIPDSKWAALEQAIRTEDERARSGATDHHVQLREALSNRVIFGRLHSLSDSLTDLRDKIKTVINYKELHDAFDELELKFQDIYDDHQLLARLPADSPDDEDTWSERWDRISERESPFHAQAQAMVEAAEAFDRLSQEYWVNDLRTQSANLRKVVGQDCPTDAAARKSAVDELGRVVRRLRKIIVLQPRELNARLVEGVRQLSLARLQERLRQLRADMANDLASAGTRLAADRAMEECLVHLGRLNTAALWHAEGHSRVQRMRDALVEIEPRTWKTFGDFDANWLNQRDDWEDLSSPNCAFRGTDWADLLVRLGGEVDAALQATPFSLKDARQRFYDYKTFVRRAMRVVDDRVKAFCGNELQPLGEDLETILKELSTPTSSNP